jgi:FixJ family two-component response regulator
MAGDPGRPAEDQADPALPVIRVVDDDARLLKALSRLLRAAGFQVATFTSAEEFLFHRRHEPDSPGCVVLDLQMPGLNGLELQERIASEKEPLPVIFLTGTADVPSSVRAMKGNAVDLLTKPVLLDDLVSAVKCAFARDAEGREKRRQARELQARYESLTPRERDVVALVVRGHLNKQIAFELGTCERTIKAHRARIMAKMRAQSVADLVRAFERLAARKPGAS